MAAKGLGITDSQLPLVGGSNHSAATLFFQTDKDGFTKMKCAVN